MVWDDDKIYLASKKGYTIMDKVTGNLLARYELESQSKGVLGGGGLGLIDRDGGTNPMMTVCFGKCLILTNNQKRAQYFTPDQGGLVLPNPVFNLDPTKLLVSLHMINVDYIVAVYDTAVQIFNASNGDLLQETGRLDQRA